MSDPEQTRPLGFLELNANVQGGAWDHIRLGAKYFTARAAGAARELFVESPKAILANEGPVTRGIQKAQRNVAILSEVGAWAVEQEMVAPDAKAPLPRYREYF